MALPEYDESGAVPLAYPLPDALRVLGISKASFYKMAESDRPVSYTVGSRRYVSRAAALAWISEREGREVSGGASDAAA